MVERSEKSLARTTFIYISIDVRAMQTEYFVGYRFPRRRWELKSDPTPNLREAIYERKGTQVIRINWPELEDLMKKGGWHDAERQLDKSYDRLERRLLKKEANK